MAPYNVLETNTSPLTIDVGKTIRLPLRMPFLQMLCYSFKGGNPYPKDIPRHPVKPPQEFFQVEKQVEEQRLLACRKCWTNLGQKRDLYKVGPYDRCTWSFPFEWPDKQTRILRDEQ